MREHPNREPQFGVVAVLAGPFTPALSIAAVALLSDISKDKTLGCLEQYFLNVAHALGGRKHCKWAVAGKNGFRFRKPAFRFFVIAKQSLGQRDDVHHSEQAITFANRKALIARQSP